MLTRPGLALAGEDIAVPLPAALHAFGRSATARLTGPAGAPLLVLLGGISGNRFVCAREDGRVGWWPGLAGGGFAADPARFRVLGIDFAADENGRLAPCTRDQASVVCAALDAVGEARAHAVIGASYGGMVALAIGQHHPERAGRLVIISAADRPHAAATAIRELQRRVVALGIAAGRGEEALGIARGMAMLTYRTPDELAQRFAPGTSGADPLEVTDVGAYLRARGEAFREVMSAGRFLSLSASIDRHRVDPAAILVPALLIGARSDQLVPATDMARLADALGARLHLLDTLYGHDMFLKEAPAVSALVQPFLAA